MTNRIVIDLFSGVGGLSLGAARAGFTVAASVELDEIAVASHTLNFPSTNHVQGDVGALTGKVLLGAAGVRAGSLTGLVGGPPCQGFSHIGKRNAEDPRNALFSHFFRLVSETRPAFYLAENVPGILSERSARVVSAALSLVPGNYRKLDPIIVRASDYGAPTTRTRVFFIGFDPERVDKLSAESFSPRKNVVPVTVDMALRGLPNVCSEWQLEEQSWQTVGELPRSAFYDRVKGARPEGVGDKKALYAAKQRLVSGFLGTKHSADTVRRFAALGHGEVDPVYRSPRLDPKGFCPTLRAGTGKDKGSFQAVRPIHPTYPRVISPREAARLQGFPDWFQFHPTKWHSFRQIGNSVSPLVAEAMLARLFKASTQL